MPQSNHSKPNQQTDLITRVSDSEIKLAGSFTKYSVPGVLQASLPIVRQAADLTIDLQGVERADSAGVALLFEWLAIAHDRQHRLQFKNVPEQMLAIARASELDTLIPVC